MPDYDKSFTAYAINLYLYLVDTIIFQISGFFMVRRFVIYFVIIANIVYIILDKSDILDRLGRLPGLKGLFFKYRNFVVWIIEIMIQIYIIFDPNMNHFYLTADKFIFLQMGKAAAYYCSDYDFDDCLKNVGKKEGELIQPFIAKKNATVEEMYDKIIPRTVDLVAQESIDHDYNVNDYRIGYSDGIYYIYGHNYELAKIHVRKTFFFRIICFHAYYENYEKYWITENILNKYF